ncbi:hypothetical protein Syun_018231 [Stephania yunnanensis]|uniref:SBP-type domain-containing protein n=1 Tax=Stephania yunnanensis TaxID=152371 RepID=A0AAP0IRX2_9MAGN
MENTNSHYSTTSHHHHHHRQRSSNSTNNNNTNNNNNIGLLWDSTTRDVVVGSTPATRFDWVNAGQTNHHHHHHPLMQFSSSNAPEHHHNNHHNYHLSYHHHHHHQQPSPAALFAGAGQQQVYPTDPHLTCLKLGKRHYFEDGGVAAAAAAGEVEGFPMGKRGRGYDGGGGGGVGVGGSSMVGVGMGVVPRCQVEGCHVALVNAKDYHRRHKVCEMHSKAPKVVVLGMEQRFCQQCSRFHVVSEFDETKRSCRRRLAGHNERRRKSSSDAISRNLSSQDHRSMSGRFPCISSSTGRALSLLSSKSTSWVSPADLSSRSSAALRELIAENRAAFLARQLLLDQNWHHHSMDDLSGAQSAVLSHVTNQHQAFPVASDWERFHESGAHVTLDLMQEPSSPFGFKSKEDDEDCCEIWKSLEGTHVM